MRKDALVMALVVDTLRKEVIAAAQAQLAVGQ